MLCRLGHPHHFNADEDCSEGDWIVVTVVAAHTRDSNHRFWVSASNTISLLTRRFHCPGASCSICHTTEEVSLLWGCGLYNIAICSEQPMPEDVDRLSEVHIRRRLRKVCAPMFFCSCTPLEEVNFNQPLPGFFVGRKLISSSLVERTFLLPYISRHYLSSEIHEALSPLWQPQCVFLPSGCHGKSMFLSWHLWPITAHQSVKNCAELNGTLLGTPQNIKYRTAQHKARPFGPQYPSKHDAVNLIFSACTESILLIPCKSKCLS